MLFLCVLWVLCPLILLSDSFLALSNFFTCMHCSVLCWIFKTGASGDLLGIFSLQLSPHQLAALRILATLVLMALSSISSIQGRLLGSIWITLSVSWSGMTLKIVCGCNPGTHLVCCSSLRGYNIVLCHLMSNVLKTPFPVFYLFFMEL